MEAYTERGELMRIEEEGSPMEGSPSDGSPFAQKYFFALVNTIAEAHQALKLENL